MIVGITGKKQAGKDTTAQFMLDELVRTRQSRQGIYKIMSYADKLKQSAAASLGYFGPDYIEFCDHLKMQGEITISFADEENVITGREYLQWFGTEGHRLVFGEDFWVDALMSEISSLATSYEEDVFFITDIRYDNEAEEILKNDLGVVIEIQRTVSTQDFDKHASEQPISRDLVTYLIRNDGTLKDLQRKSVDLLKTHII